MSDLDPVVEKAMEAAFKLGNPSGLHILDKRRWMSLFPALIATGYDLDLDAIYDWLNQRWPGTEDERGMNNRNARKVYAWAEMTVERANQSDWDDWAYNYIKKCEDELAG